MRTKSQVQENLIQLGSLWW